MYKWWQVDFIGGADCQFDHFPTIEDIREHLRLTGWNEEILNDPMSVVSDVGSYYDERSPDDIRRDLEIFRKKINP